MILGFAIIRVGLCGTQELVSHERRGNRLSAAACGCGLGRAVLLPAAPLRLGQPLQLVAYELA